MAVPRLVPIAVVLLLLAVTGCDASKPASHQSAPRPSATLAPTTSAAPKPTLTAFEQLLAKLPAFPPPPAAIPIALPGGGTAPLFHRLPVGNQKVAFLTIDDGIVRMPKDLEVMKQAHIPFTMFLIGPVAAEDPPFFKQLRSYGGVIEDHTMTHPDLRGKSYDVSEEPDLRRPQLAHQDLRGRADAVPAALRLL